MANSLNGAVAGLMELPGNFDAKVNMPSQVTEFRAFHESRAGAGLMAELVARGTPEDLALAANVFESVVGCQELREDDPHYGNFRWMMEDNHFEDLNAVVFVLDNLIPMMLRYGDRLSPELRPKVVASIALAVHEVPRLDVSIGYTNIAVYDIVNSCLGGQLLQDATVFNRGFRKLQTWADFTMANGTAFEFNSPTYTKIAINALYQLSELSNHDEVQVLARTMAARLGLGVALHIHPTIGRWAGPHGRAYHPTVVCEGSPEINDVRKWVENGTVPAWVALALNSAQLPFQTEETAHGKWNMGLTTYHSDADGARLWTASYDRGGETLGIQVDLMEWALVKRWRQDGPLNRPMLESAVARQEEDGEIMLGEAILNCGKSPARLYAAPEAKVWAVGYLGPMAPLTLKVPDGSIEIEGMGTGTVVWDHGKVTIDVAHITGEPTFAGGVLSE